MVIGNLLMKCQVSVPIDWRNITVSLILSSCILYFENISKSFIFALEKRDIVMFFVFMLLIFNLDRHFKVTFSSYIVKK